MAVGARLKAVLKQAPRDLHRTGSVGVGHQDGELVAADAEGAIGVARHLADQAAHLAQQVVAGGMAVRLVDHLEIVEVDQQQRHGHLVARIPLELTVELLLEGAVVAQPGQRVTQRIGLGRLIQALQL